MCGSSSKRGGCDLVSPDGLLRQDLVSNENYGNWRNEFTFAETKTYLAVIAVNISRLKKGIDSRD
jgi:hypothetical protein